MRRQSVVTIKGPRGSYKSHIARNFLLSGLTRGESAILVHLGATGQFNPSSWDAGGAPWLTSPVVGNVLFRKDSRGWGEFALLQNREDGPATESSNDTGIESRNTSKFCRDVWRYNGPIESPLSEVLEPGNEKRPIFVEFDFKPGALLPEQFLKHVRDVFRQVRGSVADFRRIVLDDVSLIGTSYPRLHKSKTVGDLFLTAFVHFARYYELDLIMVGTSGEFAEADAVVKRASTLADSVLTCGFCDVFGDRLITVTGDGLMAAHQHKVPKEEPTESITREYGEFVPGVVVPLRNYQFDVDLKKLEGLVGFQTGEIHRPGAVVNLFSQGDTLEKYNDEIRTMLECAFASSGSSHRSSKTSPEGFADANVVVREFGWDKSTALYDSLRVLHGNPVDKTIVCALDEFYSYSPNRSSVTRDNVTGSASTPAVRSASTSDPPIDGGSYDDRSSEPALAESALAGGGALSTLCDDLTRVEVRREDFCWKHFRGSVWPESVRCGVEPVKAAPYYSNVLVMAYHEALEPMLRGCLEPFFSPDQKNAVAQRLHSWDRLYESLSKGSLQDWRNVMANSKRVSVFGIGSDERWAKPDDWVFFECGDNSTETLSCIMLDALARPGRTDLRMNTLAADAKQDEIRREFTALGQLFYERASLETCEALRKREASRVQELGRSASKGRQLTQIYPFAGIYVSWYTQLRELLADYPELAPSLRVAALPGGGIRGDWYLGIAKGSVSVALGQSIIRILCGRDEDNRRFIEGVGLPTHREYDNAGIYKAWPRGNVDLSEMLTIHRLAHARSAVDNYVETRATLGALGEQVVRSFDDAAMRTRSIGDFLERLERMASLVTGKQAESSPVRREL